MSLLHPVCASTEGDNPIEARARGAIPLSHYQPLEVERSDTPPKSIPWYRNKKVWLGVGITAGIAWLTGVSWAMTQDSIVAIPSCPKLDPLTITSTDACGNYLVENFPAYYTIGATRPPYSAMYASLEVEFTPSGYSASSPGYRGPAYCNFFGYQAIFIDDNRYFDAACCSVQDIKKAYETNSTSFMNKIWNCTALDKFWITMGCKAVPPFRHYG